MYEDIIKPEEIKMPFIPGTFQAGQLTLSGVDLKEDKHTEYQPEFAAEKIIELTELIEPQVTLKKWKQERNLRLTDVLNFLTHILDCNQYDDPITSNEMIKELQACIKHINTPTRSGRSDGKNVNAYLNNL